MSNRVFLLPVAKLLRLSSRGFHMIVAKKYDFLHLILMPDRRQAIVLCHINILELNVIVLIMITVLL